MKIIQMGRGEGKTHRALRWLMLGEPLAPNLPHTHNRLLVVSTTTRVAEVVHELHLMLGRPQPPKGGDESSLMRDDFQRWSLAIAPIDRLTRWDRRLDSRIEIMIDDLDEVLFTLFGMPVAWATLTEEGR
jgi:hypothetical protein